METEHKNIINLKVGFYSSIILTSLTIITFGFAMIAIPPSGPNCPGNCMDYPFKEILSYYPRDYYWMYFTVFQLFAYQVFIISNHFIASKERRIFSTISVAFASISATVLLIAYFTQFAVVPISVMEGESEGIALLTQYNGHGIFIVLEELGYILMSIAFLFLAPVFNQKNRLEKSIRLILILPFILTVLSFIYYSLKFGLNRHYRFEVATITANWLVTIIAGILIGVFFKRLLKKNSLQ
ncbi:MAG: hypothetical protein GQ564_10800 [Bacteroidales bacterium]|nr:hypothetical protein [Bacteroidales bacterium]